MAHVNILKIIQIITAILGLIFAASTKYSYWTLIVFYASAIVYLAVLLICLVAGKSGPSSTLQAIIEGIIGVAILVCTIVVLSTTQGTDVLLIMAIVIGFLFPALLFISVYERI